MEETNFIFIAALAKRVLISQTAPGHLAAGGVYKHGPNLQSGIHEPGCCENRLWVPAVGRRPVAGYQSPP